MPAIFAGRADSVVRCQVPHRASRLFDRVFVLPGITFFDTAEPAASTDNVDVRALATPSCNAIDLNPRSLSFL